MLMPLVGELGARCHGEPAAAAVTVCGSPLVHEADIMEHPRYPDLIRAVVQCRQVGATKNKRLSLRQLNRSACPHSNSTQNKESTTGDSK
mmetsp:Transcript_39506/g.117498  ORF Transcript_39506/g.117498 Transcript_39506/m.117498 type:complete len:90 (+) Transcript_39506:406-675(+)